MIDRLERIVYQVKNGLISEEQGMLALQKDAEHESRIDADILNEYDGFSDNPLDLLIKEETKAEQWALIQESFSTLTTLERQVFWYCFGEDMPVRKVSYLLQIPKSTIHDILIAATDKIKAYVSDKITENNCILCEDLFYKHINIDGPSRVKPYGMPYELLQHVNIGGCWRNHSGRKVWVSRQKCLLSKYFEDSFSDALTVCPIRCGNKRCSYDKA